MDRVKLPNRRCRSINLTIYGSICTVVSPVRAQRLDTHTYLFLLTITGGNVGSRSDEATREAERTVYGTSDSFLVVLLGVTLTFGRG